MGKIQPAAKQFEKYADPSQLELFPDGKLFRISYDPEVGKMKVAARKWESLEDLRECFSVENKGAFFMFQYGFRAEPKLYAISKFGYFSDGLVFSVLAKIREQWGSLSCVAMSEACRAYVADRVTPLKSFLDGKQVDPRNVAEDVGRNEELEAAGKQPYTWREYQKTAVQRLLEKGYGRGLVEIPTGGGKSFMLANFVWTLRCLLGRPAKTLLLVPNKHLVVQFEKDLVDYGWKPSQVSQFTAGMSRKQTEAWKSAEIVVANRQYVFKHAAELPAFDVLVCDEAHTCVAESTAAFVERLPAAVKIGCSGTLPREKHLGWQLEGMFGRTVSVEEITDLQKSGFISSLKITLLQITDTVVEADRNYLFHVKPLRRWKPDESGYSEIAFNEASDAEHAWFAEHYRELYKPVFAYLEKLPSNTLVLFDRIEVGKNVFSHLSELYAGKKRVFYVDGGVPVEERESTRQEFEKSDGNLLVAQTATFSTGVNIKRLENICFLTSSKSFSRTIQSIGRALRLHASKKEAHLVDVAWNYKYSQRHLAERLRIYREMYGKGPDEVLRFSV